MAEVIIVDSAEEAGALVGGAIGDAISQKPEFVLGVATGSTPLTTYRSLAEVIRERGIDVSRVRAFALDEYLGLPEGHPESYRTVVDREVVNVLGLSPENVRVPDGDVSHAETACTDYELAIRAAGGVDVQLLGIGTSGHIGFNEPGSSLASRTRIKALAQQTRQDNARFFDRVDDVPTHAVTQGIGTILDARHLVLLAFGSQKAAVLAQALEGPVTARCPASAVQLHPDVTVVADTAAAAKLELVEYYEHSWAHNEQGLRFR